MRSPSGTPYSPSSRLRSCFSAAKNAGAGEATQAGLGHARRRAARLDPCRRGGAAGRPWRRSRQVLQRQILHPCKHPAPTGGGGQVHFRQQLPQARHQRRIGWRLGAAGAGRLVRRAGLLLHLSLHLGLCARGLARRRRLSLHLGLGLDLRLGLHGRLGRRRGRGVPSGGRRAGGGLGSAIGAGIRTRLASGPGILCRAACSAGALLLPG